MQNICGATVFVKKDRCVLKRSLPLPMGEVARVSDIAVVLTKNRAVLALCIHGMLQGVLMSVSGSLGSWLVFRFVWNITPELREKMAKACQA